MVPRIFFNLENTIIIGIKYIWNFNQMASFLRKPLLRASLIQYLLHLR